MPTAPDELREKMDEYFGDPIDDHGPTAFLVSKGWREIANGYWVSPKGAALSDKEWNCIDFLIQEWDHGYKGPAE